MLLILRPSPDNSQSLRVIRHQKELCCVNAFGDNDTGTIFCFPTSAEVSTHRVRTCQLRALRVHPFPPPSLCCTLPHAHLRWDPAGDLLLVKIQWCFLRSPCPTSLEPRVPPPSGSSLFFLLLVGCTIHFISYFSDLPNQGPGFFPQTFSRILTTSFSSYTYNNRVTIYTIL